MATFTPAEKLQVIKWFYAGHSAQDCVNLFTLTFVDRPAPSRQAIYDFVSCFEKHYCLNNCVKCKPRKVSPQNVEERERRDVLACSIVEIDSTKSTRSAAEELGIGNRCVSRIWKRNGLKCFKYSKTQEILPDDNFRRMEFCETVMEKIHLNEDFVTNILFTDESTFPLHGKHNPSVLRYWARENQHRHYANRTQYPQKLNVWAGLLGDHLIGPFFIDGILNGDKYLQLLQNEILPAVQETGINQEIVWFQHDGCPAHNKRGVKEFLENTFPDRLIAGTGNIKWPPRSSDLSPNDFFLWGHLKNIVYTHEAGRAGNLAALQEKITEAANSITADMLANVRANFYDRLGQCLAVQGGIFEPLV